MRSLLTAMLLGALPAGIARAQCPDGTPPPCRTAAARPGRAALPPSMSVAVLDFENLSRDTADSYLTDGLADELTSRLGQVGRLTVASRTAVRRLHNVSDMAVPDIGRTLNVAYLVHGSLRRAGARLRVTAELLHATTGAIAWSSQYDESQQDLLAIQEAVGTAVATAVAGRLLPAERTTLAARPTRSADAYDAYLRARALYIVSPIRAQYLEASALLERALALDSSFAAAWAALSQVSSRMFWYYVDRSDARLREARTAADRALALAPNAAESHVASGYCYYWGYRDYAHALQEFSAALVARPNDPEVHSAIANVARRQGSWEQSLAGRTRAVELDPGSRTDLNERALTLHFLRRFEEAERDYERSLVPPAEDFSSHGFLAGLALARDGAPDRAAPHLQYVSEHPDYFIQQAFHDPGVSLPMFRAAGPHQEAVLRAQPPPTAEGRVLHQLVRGQVLASLGRRDEGAVANDSARAILLGLLAARPEDDGFHAQLAVADAGLGRCDDAVREAERATTLLPVSADAMTGPQRLQVLAEVAATCGRPEQAIDVLGRLLAMPSFVTPALLRADPVYAPLRDNPRFQQLISRN